MRVDLFDFDLPPDRIALRPVRPRDAARLLVVAPGAAEPLRDRTVRDLPDLLAPGDAIVFNDTKVIPAQLFGRRLGRGESEPAVDATLHARVDGSTWRAFLRGARKVKVGDRLRFGTEGEACFSGMLDAEVIGKGDGGEAVLAFSFHGAVLDEAVAALGAMPLPPYIAGKRPADGQDCDDYQTMFAAEEGAVAAPTAGLHFTPGLVARLEARDVSRHLVTLHVGAGTFLPVKAEDTCAHSMHAETGRVSAGTADALNAVRASGGRIVAVGTTSLRLLESALDESGRFAAFDGATDIFLTPGTPVRSADILMTNFHLPRSTLFMLVAAFSGLDLMQRAYRHAIDESYRFYSYGDACLLHREVAS